MYADNAERNLYRAISSLNYNRRTNHKHVWETLWQYA